MPAAAFVGSSSAATLGTSVSVPAPAGLQAGDHQLLILVSGTSGSAMSVPGFTPAGAFSGSGGESSMNIGVFIASSSSATGAVTVDNPASTSNRLLTVARLAWRGGPGWLTTPAPASAVTAAGTSHALPSQATTAVDQLVVGAVVYDADVTSNTVSFTPPTGWTERADVDLTASGSFERGQVGVFDIARTASGTQSGTATASRSDVSFVWSATLAAAASSGSAPTVSAGADAAVTVGQTFSRTATENDNGSAITARRWEIISGPADVGSFNTSQSVSYTPTVAGTYTFRYTATNAHGTSTPDDMVLTATAGPLEPVDVIPFGTAAGLVHYAFDIGQEGGGGRTLHPPSEIAGGLEFDPEFLAISDATGNWVQAAVREDATTTSGSTNPRAEGRETQEGSDSNLGFTPTSGTHWQRFRARVMEHPTSVENAGVSIGQVHSLGDDILMVRTRVRAGGTMDLVLREYDAGTDNSVDVLTLRTGYQFGDVVDLLFLMHAGRAYVFVDDFLVPVHRADPSVWPVTGTYMQKWGTYSQNTAAWPAGTWGRAHFRNVAHFHTGWAQPANYFGCPEVAPGAAVTATAGQEVTRTATETGTGITARKWAILEGPTGVGTTIGTAAALAWVPPDPGVYTLMYGAKNAQGWSNPAFLEVTVTPASAGGGGPAFVRDQTTGAQNVAAVSHPITLPAREVGDQLVVAFANDESTDPTTAVPDAASTARGWSVLGTEEQGTTTNHRFTIFYKAAAEGGAADALNVTLAFGQEATYVAHSIADAAGAPQIGMDEGGATSPVLGVAYTGLEPGPWLSLIYLGTDSSLTTAQNPTMPEPSPGVPPLWTRTAAVNPTTTSSAATFTFERTMPAGTTTIDPPQITLSTGEQWIRYHLIFPGSSAVAPTVSAGADATVDQHDPFVRTAAENDGGTAITSRAWTVLSGPNQVGATLSTAAALNWTPTVGGTYVLRYVASNAAGTSVPDDVTVTVNPLIFPLTATLRLGATVVGSKAATGAATATPLRLTAGQVGGKQAVAEPAAPLRLAASIFGQRINTVTATLRLSASAQTASNNGAHVTASMRLSAAVTNRSRVTPAVEVAAPIRLAAEVAAESARTADMAATLHLVAEHTGVKDVPYAPAASIRLAAGIADVQHATPVDLTAPLLLTADVSDRFHTAATDLLATLPLRATVATSSVRFNRNVLAQLRLRAAVVGQNIVAEIRAVAPRADTTVKYDLVAVARIPQASGPPTFLEADPIDWTDLNWTEAINEAPTLSASVKLSSLTEPILQRLRTPHDTPTELWCYRNGRKVFAGPLLGGRVSSESLSLEAAGVETYTRWMHVTSDLTFTDTDQFAIVAALINQWQQLEYGHFGIELTTQIVENTAPIVVGQAAYRAVTADVEYSDNHCQAARPSGTAAGDLLIAVHACDDDGALSEMGAPDGWTLLGSHDVGASDTPRVKVWQRVATSSEPSSYVFPDSPDAHSALAILRVTGHNPAQPLAVTPVFAGSSDPSANHTAPSVAGVAGGLLVTVHAGETGGTSRSYWGAPTGMTSRVDVAPSSNGYVVLGVNTQELTAAGATGTRTAACSGSAEWVAASLVIAPVPVAPPPPTVSGPTSGVVRSITYPVAELHVVADRIDDLTKLADGLDWRIDPTTRRLEMYHPARGVDRSIGEDAIIFDQRNITSSDIAFSMSPADLASDGLAAGTASGSDAPLIATYGNPELRAKFGRVGIVASFQAADQAALNAGVQSVVDARSEVLLLPGPNARVTLDADLSDYDVGDTISYHAHGRLTVSRPFRIRKRSVRVAKTNTEAVNIEFV